VCIVAHSDAPIVTVLMIMALDSWLGRGADGWGTELMIRALGIPVQGYCSVLTAVVYNYLYFIVSG